MGSLDSIVWTPYARKHSPRVMARLQHSGCLQAVSLPSPCSPRGRLLHGRHFTYKSITGDMAITFVSTGVEGAFATEEHPYAAHGPWLQVRRLFSLLLPLPPSSLWPLPLLPFLSNSWGGPFLRLLRRWLSRTRGKVLCVGMESGCCCLSQQLQNLFLASPFIPW